MTYDRRDFFRERFTLEELRQVLATAKLSPRDVLSRRSRVYKERTSEIDAMVDAELLQLMVDEPTLLRRPLVVTGSRSVLGFDREGLRSIAEAVNENG